VLNFIYGLALNNIKIIELNDVLPSIKDEAFAKSSILFKFKEDEDFNHRHTLSIPRIKI